MHQRLPITDSVKTQKCAIQEDEHAQPDRSVHGRDASIARVRAVENSSRTDTSEAGSPDIPDTVLSACNCGYARLLRRRQGPSEARSGKGQSIERVTAISQR